MGALIDALRARFADRILDSHEKLGDETVVVPPAALVEIATVLRDDPAFAFDMLADLTVVDYAGRTPRFEVVSHLLSTTHRCRLRLKVLVDDPEPRVPSLFGVWKSASWAEREAFDMFGVRFDGNPDLRRILMYPEFEGYPLRKDYPHSKRQPLVPERDPVENPWPPRKLGAAR